MMATSLSLEPGGPPPVGPVGLAPAAAWTVIAIGIVATFGWVMVAQKLGETIVIDTVGTAMSVYYGLLFAPLVALSLGLGAVGRVSVAKPGAMPLRWAGVGLLLGAGGFAVTVAYAWLNGTLARGAGGYLGAGLVALSVVLTLFQVFAEELLFRGWLQPALGVRIGVVAALAITAVLFAALHLPSGVRDPLSLCNLALGGIWFGLLAQRSDGLVAPVAAHFAWNALEDPVLGLSPNPGVGALGSIFDFDLLGAPLWGGQEDGLNASIGTAIVLVAVILPLAWPRPASATA